MTAPKLPDKVFTEVVRNTPLVAIDIIARNAKGDVLVGLRNNEPARGFWFVPGGSIRKNERLDDAFERISKAEFGVELSRQEANFLGVYEHIYDENFSGDPSFGTHYVVLACEVTLNMEISELPDCRDDQHSELKWILVEELLAADDVHQYTKQYFQINQP